MRLPWLLVALDLGCVVEALCRRSWLQAVYWAAAAVLTAAVTLMDG